MRFFCKLTLILLVALCAQTGFEVFTTVRAYPAPGSQDTFNESFSSELREIENKFIHCNRLSKWIVVDVLAMPFERVPPIVCARYPEL